VVVVQVAPVATVVAAIMEEEQQTQGEVKTAMAVVVIPVTLRLHFQQQPNRHVQMVQHQILVVIVTHQLHQKNKI
jgi:hypothetical protein